MIVLIYKRNRYRISIEKINIILDILYKNIIDI